MTIAGDISLTDDQWSISATGVVSGLSGTNTSFIAGDLSCTNCIGATEVDESGIASTSLSDTANIGYLNQSETVANDWTFGLAEAEDLALDIAISGTQSGQGEKITLTNSSSSGNQYGLYIDNADSTGTTDALVYLDNSDTDTVVTSAIQIANSTRFTNILNIGGATLTGSEITILDRGIALSELTDSGTLTAGRVDINGGAIDGTAIGSASRSTALFTTLGTNGNVTLGDANTDTVVINSGSSGTGISFGDSCVDNFVMDTWLKRVFYK